MTPQRFSRGGEISIAMDQDDSRRSTPPKDTPLVKYTPRSPTNDSTQVLGDGPCLSARLCSCRMGWSTHPNARYPIRRPSRSLSRRRWRATAWRETPPDADATGSQPATTGRRVSSSTKDWNCRQLSAHDARARPAPDAVISDDSCAVNSANNGPLWRCHHLAICCPTIEKQFRGIGTAVGAR